MSQFSTDHHSQKFSFPVHCCHRCFLSQPYSLRSFPPPFQPVVSFSSFVSSCPFFWPQLPSSSPPVPFQGLALLAELTRSCSPLPLDDLWQLRLFPCSCDTCSTAPVRNQAFKKSLVIFSDNAEKISLSSPNKSRAHDLLVTNTRCLATELQEIRGS